MKNEALSFKYQLEKQQPRLGPGGITRGASVRIAAQNLGLTLEEVDRLPKKEVYFAQGQVPDEHAAFSSPRSYPQEHGYRSMQDPDWL